MARLYRKRPVVIEAFQLGIDSIPDWFMDRVSASSIILHKLSAHIHTVDGIMVADNGDYIIRGVRGEIYPCKFDIFKEIYEAVE